MTNFGDIVNVSSKISSLEEQVSQLKKMKEEGFGYAILYPSKVTKPTDEGLPGYISSYHPISLCSKAYALYKDPWKVDTVSVKLKMGEAPIFKSDAGGWLSSVESVKFVATDGTYVYIKSTNCANWLRVGEIARNTKGGRK